jgi:hypothetical protein
MIAAGRILLVLLALASGYAAAAGMYKWKDKEGNWHFSDQEPPGQKAETIRVSPGLGHYAPASRLAAPDTPLGLSILSPESASSTAGEWVQIVGEFAGPPDTGVSILGGPVISQDGRHFLSRVFLHQGINDIPIVLTTLDGHTKRQTITVTRSEAPMPGPRLVADDLCGIVPWDLAFHVDGVGPSMRLMQASFDFNANGVPDAHIEEISQHATYRYDASGLYTAKATVTLANIADPAKVEQRTLEQYVLCTDRAYIRQTLIFVYESLRDGIARNDVEASLRAFAPDVREEYEPMFRAFAGKGADVANMLGTLEDGQIMPRVAMGLLVRTEKGQSHGFPIQFGMGNDGVWRINEM